MCAKFVKILDDSSRLGVFLINISNVSLTGGYHD
jgi:hypothetical protein